jgi:hypothetical protein
VENESPIAQLIREAIEAVAAPEVRLQIMHRALHMAHEHEIPPSGEPLHAFVDKHLRTATAFYLGNEAAEAIMKNLEPLVSLAEEVASQPPHRRAGGSEPTQRVGRDRQHSGVSARDEVSKESDTDTSKYPRVQPLGSALPMVFVATRNRERCTGIEEHLKDAAAVQQIEDVVAFLDNLKATASLSPLVVIDCVEASVQPSTIATLAHELPKGSGVLLWGATDQHRELVDVATRDRGWLRCDADTSPGDVAALIQMLLGE